MNTGAIAETAGDVVEEKQAVVKNTITEEFNNHA